MTESDRDAFAELLTQALGFYGQAVSPFALGVWWQACQGCELQQLRRSLTAHAMDPERGQFAPGIESAYLLQHQVGVLDETNRRRLGEGEALDVGDAHGLELQHHARQVGALDLGFDARTPREVILFAVQPDADTG